MAIAEKSASGVLVGQACRQLGAEWLTGAGQCGAYTIVRRALKGAYLVFALADEAHSH